MPNSDPVLPQRPLCPDVTLCASLTVSSYLLQLDRRSGTGTSVWGSNPVSLSPPPNTQVTASGRPLSAGGLCEGQEQQSLRRCPFHAQDVASPTRCAPSLPLISKRKTTVGTAWASCVLRDETGSRGLQSGRRRLPGPAKGSGQ